MSIKSKVFAATAALTILGGVGAAGAITASAATPSCGSSCVNVYSALFDNYATAHPAFVMDVKQQAQNVGQPVILWRASNSDPAEDFTYALQGTVHDFYVAGLASAALNLHYATNPAFEIEYSPYGVDSGLCVGTATVPAAGTPVSLQPCGVTAKTTWIADLYDFGGTVPYFAGINGSETNFSHPYVLSYPSNGYPTDNPRPQLRTDTLHVFSAGQAVDYEKWFAYAGVLP